MVIWSYLGHLGLVLDRASGGQRHNPRLHVGHEPIDIGAHVIGLVIGLRITPVSRFDIL